MKKWWISGICLVLVLVIAAGLFHCKQEQDYKNAHVFLDNHAYPKDASAIHLQGQYVNADYVAQLQALLPDCKITWDVPFQGSEVSCDVTELTVSRLSMEDVEILTSCFPRLTHIHAESCQDYAALAALKAAKPHWTVEHFVKISGINHPPIVTKTLNLETGDYEELMANLAYLENLESVHFSAPELSAKELTALVDAYPDIAFTWEQTVLGVPYSSEITELDLSGAQLDGTETLEAELQYFPNLETLLLCQCNLDSETLAAYRDRVRDQYKVVWSVKLGRVWTRTDTDTYMPIRENNHVRDQHLTELKYCEDLIVVDLGHMGVEDTEWIYHTPKLQFLILADTDVSDITPIGTLKELIYLELFKSPAIRDYTPLLGCTALQDLNLAYTSGDVTVLSQMTWLDSLWANYCGATPEQKQLLRDSLPDTLLELDHGWHMGNGWRDRPNYYVMRDILKMPYYDWGSKRLAEENKKKYG